MKQCLEKWRPTYIAKSVEAINPAYFKHDLILGNFDTVLFDSRSVPVLDCEKAEHQELCENIRIMSQIGLGLYLLNEEGEQRQNELEESLSDGNMDIDVVCPELLKLESDLAPANIANWSLHSMIDYIVRKKRLQKERVLVVGDSILTDVAAANDVGVYSLLVAPREKDRTPSRGIRGVAEKVIRKYFLSNDVPTNTNDFPDEVRAANPLHRDVRVSNKNSIQRYLKKYYKETGDK